MLIGFVFYGLHTGIDSSFSSSATKNVFDETAKLFAVACFTLAGLAALRGIAGRPERSHVGDQQG